MMANAINIVPFKPIMMDLFVSYATNSVKLAQITKTVLLVI